jgi:hypothetical protein
MPAKTHSVTLVVLVICAATSINALSYVNTADAGQDIGMFITTPNKTIGWTVGHNSYVWRVWLLLTSPFHPNVSLTHIITSSILCPGLTTLCRR